MAHVLSQVQRSVRRRRKPVALTSTHVLRHPTGVSERVIQFKRINEQKATIISRICSRSQGSYTSPTQVPHRPVDASMVTVNTIPTAILDDDERTIPILDVRTSALNDSGNPIRDQIVAGMSTLGDKWPAAVLFDERGLKLYDAKVSQADGYYPFVAEMKILHNHADDIAHAILSRGTPGSVGQDVIELGSGPMKKTALLLSAFARQISGTRPIPTTNYYALDLDKRELIRTLGELGKSEVGPALKGKMSTAGLWGTYDDGLRFIADGGLQGSGKVPQDTEDSDSESDSTPVPKPSNPGQPLHMLFVGTSISNFETRQEASAFLRSLPLRPGSGDTLLLGMDQNDNVEEIERAYNNPDGTSKEFLMNALVNAGRILGDESLFCQDGWEYVAHFNTSLRRFEYHFEALRALDIIDPMTGISYTFSKSDQILAHVSHKFSPGDADKLFAEADLRPMDRWTDDSSKYTVWLLERPAA
ncbi:hypothetical protein PYCCODRAFT_1430586 [Trametes coccinea BRFM310]|uniref:Histidine-specific methyltransferase SAM-dependent domain-containing protein n=1 Tax=Trametes coccinea (strain BRFM310) TaxID=1353009 RepID=A0A1Y2J553_TRAC3|nr:hypothetical protein PYCCODRAFT_1430586 [Trametes coccinea BRFM310]